MNGVEDLISATVWMRLTVCQGCMKVDQVPVDDLRLFPLWDVAGGGMILSVEWGMAACSSRPT